jgi:hypothetical protein
MPRTETSRFRGVRRKPPSLPVWEVRLDHDAPRGDIVQPLASLLLALARSSQDGATLRPQK